MTKLQAEKFGEEAGRRRAEWIYTDTPYHRLAATLEIFRRPDSWKIRESDLHQNGNVPTSLKADFARGYERAGVKAIEKYIKEGLSDGYLKEV